MHSHYLRGLEGRVGTCQAHLLQFPFVSCQSGVGRHVHTQGDVAMSCSSMCHRCRAVQRAQQGVQHHRCKDRQGSAGSGQTQEKLSQGTRRMKNEPIFNYDDDVRIVFRPPAMQWLSTFCDALSVDGAVCARKHESKSV